jgi:hypothetical protein
MSWWAELFGGAGERGISPQFPLLASDPQDEQAMLNSLQCPGGHTLQHRRQGSVPGHCPEAAAHCGSPADNCIVDQFEVTCSGGEFRADIYFDMHHPVHAQQHPPLGLRNRPQPRELKRISLHYEDKHPTWKLRTVQPSRFREVRYRLQTRLFLLPEGALLGSLLNLYDIPNQPYFIHRIMDLSDPEVGRYIEACGRRSQVTAIFESQGQEPGFRRKIDLDGPAWLTHLIQGRAHNARIHSRGDKALEIFLDIFHRVSRERGVEPAWDEVERLCAHHPPK